MTELSLVIPFFNEEKCVAEVLSSLQDSLSNTKINYEVVAVDNGSSDRTGEIIDSFNKKNPRIRKVRVDVNQGYGFGIRQGLNSSKGKYIGYLWGDNQIPNESTLEVFNQLKENNYDLSKVTRISRTETLFRKIQSKCYNFMMYTFFGIRSRDLNGCPKIFKKEVYDSLNIKSDDWFIDAELMIKSVRKNYQIKEIPVIPVERKGGKSKVNIKTTFEFIYNILRARFGRI